jgi:hypothetical protein
MFGFNSNLLVKGLFLSLSFAGAAVAKPTSGNFVAVANHFELDSKLPEPFARAKTVHVYVNHDYHDASLVFLVSEAEGIEITFPIVKDSTDECNNREIIAAPPEGSTPYYKDFEIKVIDYSENKCENLKIAAPTFASLKSYEVRHKATTHSTILAEALKPAPAEQ